MKLRPVFQLPTKSYADHTPAATPDTLDCSLGVNPYGYPPQVEDALRAFALPRLAHYPHSHAAESAILRHWSGQATLTAQNLVLCDGSVSALYLINSLFSLPEAEVVGFVPSFTDMLVNARMQGMRYTQVPLLAKERFKANVDRLLAEVTEKTAMVYVDNPNNPTGQTIPLDQLERILARCKALDVCAVIDEAYGDFISREESALALWEKYGSHMVVVRTLSKGFGLAGLRAGYIVAPPELVSAIGKISNPYMMNELTREAVSAAMETPDYPASHGEDFAAVKAAIAARTGGNLTLAETDGRVPICTLRHKDPAADLARLLFDAGILTVSGAEFDGLDGSAVRLRVPKREDAAVLLRAVEVVNGPSPA